MNPIYSMRNFTPAKMRLSQIFDRFANATSSLFVKFRFSRTSLRKKTSTQTANPNPIPIKMGTGLAVGQIQEVFDGITNLNLTAVKGYCLI